MASGEGQCLKEVIRGRDGTVADKQRKIRESRGSRKQLPEADKALISSHLNLWETDSSVQIQEVYSSSLYSYFKDLLPLFLAWL